MQKKMSHGQNDVLYYNSYQEEKRKQQEENDKSSLCSEKGSGEAECSEGAEHDDDVARSREEGDSGIDANSQVTQ